MQTVGDNIMSKFRRSGRGSVFTPSDFLDVGTRPSVDTALSRLVVQGRIRRLARGLYDYPKKHRLLGDLLPSLDEVAQVLAKDTDSSIQVSGARALYLLGLTSQVPAQTAYLTNGRSKDVAIGGAVLKLRHASPKVMAGAGSKAGAILQAIRYLGKDNLSDKLLDQIAGQLSKQDRLVLKRIARHAPGWAQAKIARIIA